MRGFSPSVGPGPLPARSGASRPSPMRMSPPAIAAEGLTKRFGEATAVEDLSFTVPAGEVFGFLGPNGAGKTTTVRMLIGLIKPNSGTARLHGREAGSDDSLRRRIGVMAETPGLYESLTVEENLSFFADLHGVAAADRPALFDDCLERAGLGERRDHRAGTLSKGLRRRAALARALVGSPDILFLDEPTAGLDPESSAEVRKLMENLRRSGATVFLTTHRLEEAARVCDRVAILNTRLLTIGRPDDLTRGGTLEINIVLGGPPSPQTLDDLAALPGVRGAEAAGSGVRMQAESRRAVPEAVRLLAARGEDVFSVAEDAPTLEEAYLDLVGTGL